jgi:beta-glucosidase
MPDGARSASPGPDGKPLCAWFSASPEGYLETIRWLHKRDSAAPILLTENGWCGNATIGNRDQLWYFQSYLDQVHTAITVDKIPVVGYTAWSFMDNYEWGSFQPRFGLYYVNYTHATGSKQGYTPLPTDLTRIPRTAATWYAQVAKTKCMEVSGAVMEDKTVVAVSTTAALIAFAVAVVGATAVVLLRRRRSTLGENEPLLRQ